jgi:hypothetical protein
MASSPRKNLSTSNKTPPSSQPMPLNFTDSIGKSRFSSKLERGHYTNRINNETFSNCSDSGLGSPYSIKSSSSKFLKVYRSSTTESVEQMTNHKDKNDQLYLNNWKEHLSLENLVAVEKPQPQIYEEYEHFVKRNLFNFWVIKRYCEEITAQPFEAMMATDAAVGRWLDQEIQTLQTKILGMGRELSKYKIDTTILDVYKNMLIMISKRYALLNSLSVTKILITGKRSMWRE